VAFKQSKVVREFEIRIGPMNEESIFAIALQKKTTGERLAFLDEACAGNAGLRAAVEELLHADSDAGSFLAHPPAAMDATVVSEPSSRDTINSGEWAFQLPFLEPCDKPDRIGKLDQYEIMEVVGHGGMGAVLRAFDTKLSRVVAVKVMSPDLAANPMAVNRFLREAQAAAAVHHDHVVTIHAVDDAHQPPYIVMEFIEGQTLQQKIDRVGALELKHILRIGSQAAAGLAAAHNMGLIHRDVKPANILLENGVERAKITDFGLARAADDLQITQIGLIAGTPQYMSPEQAKGEPIEARSDLFSLGSVLYTMCTGRPAFRADNTIAILRRVCDDTPRPIREVNPEIPQWLETIVNKLLAKDPAERFQTAAEVEQLLNQCLAHVQNPAYVALPAILEAPLVHRATVGGDAKKTGRVPGVERSSTPASHRQWALAAAIVLLIGAALTEAAGVTHLAATVIRIATGEGTLVIEADEPGVKVAIDGGEVTIHGTGVEEVRLRPGSYKLAASKDGQPVAVDQELVTITRGGKQVVRVAVDRSSSNAFKQVALAKWTPPENPDPYKILTEAREDVRARRYETALAKHVWYHENALKYQPSQSGVRLSFALTNWLDLAKDYPPALAKLKAIRDQAVAGVKDGTGAWQSFHDMVSINTYLGDDALTRDVFAFLHTYNPEMAKRAFGVAEPALIRAKAYKLCGSYLEPEASLQQSVALYRHNQELAKKDKKYGGPNLLDFSEKSFTNNTTTLIAILVINGRQAEAEKIAHDAKKEWDNASFHAAIEKALQGTVPEPWPSSRAIDRSVFSGSAPLNAEADVPN
jgi:Protein kinase domain